MSWEQYFGAGDFEKTRPDRMLKEVKELVQRRDNMVARVVSVYGGREKHRSQRMRQMVSSV